MSFTYYPRGVCSRQFDIELENGVIKDISIIGGCNGNLQGISNLIKGQKAVNVIRLLKGTKCGMKSTSCPDQIALALEKALEAETA